MTDLILLIVFLLSAGCYAGARIGYTLCYWQFRPQVNDLLAEQDRLFEDAVQLRQQHAVLLEAIAVIRTPLVVPSPIEPDKFLSDQHLTVCMVNGYTSHGKRLGITILAEHKPDIITAVSRIFGGPTMSNPQLTSTNQ